MTNIIIKLESNAQGNLVFYPGHLLRGVAELILDHPKKIRGFYIVINGVAKCHWTESRTRTVGSGKDRRTQHYTVHYNGCQVYLSSKTYLFGYHGAEAVEVPAGKATYNFQCELPTQLPETIAGSMGSISYNVEAVLDIPWSFDKEIKTEFTVVRHDNLNDYPSLSLPLKMEEVKTFCCLFCKSGPCLITASIPHGGYGGGETIPVKVEYRNQSNTDIEETRIRIIRYTSFTSSTPETKTRSESMTIVESVFEGVKRNMNRNIEGSISLPVIMTSSNARFCNVVKIEYMLEVAGSVSGCHSNPEISFPIEIGRIAFRESAPQAPLPAYAPPVPSYAQPQPLYAPSAPIDGIQKPECDPSAPVAVTDVDLPPSFDEAITGIKKPLENFQPATSDNHIGWAVNGSNQNQPSAPPTEKI